METYSDDIQSLTLEQRMARLELIHYEHSLPDYAIVGAEYVAWLFNLSVEAVKRGRYGTHKIPRCRNHPIGFRKRDVHRVLREASKPIKEKAAAEIQRAKLLKRKSRGKSIIRMKAAE